MLPANQFAGFGDLSFNSHPHSISHFNSPQIPFSYPNPSKFQLELQDPNGGEEEDEWAVYASTRVASREKIGGGGGLQAGPSQKSGDNVDEWGTFVASSGGNPADHAISRETSGKVENGGLQVGLGLKREDWGLFGSTPVESQSNGNGSTSVSSKFNSIGSDIINQTNNGGLQTGLTQNEDWGLFSSFSCTTTKGISSNQTTDQKDRLDDLNVNPSQNKILVEEEDDEWGTFVSTPVAPEKFNNDSNGTTSNFDEISQRKLGSLNLHTRPVDNKEEWGEFVSSPIASGTKTDVTSSSSASPNVKWAKPKGPIPLSFFGGAEEDLAQERTKLETLPHLIPDSVSHSDPHSDASPSNSSNVVKENILNHYTGIENLELKNVPSPKINGHDFNEEATATNSLNGSENTASNLGSVDEKAEHSTSKWDPFITSENEVVEEAWEFKDGSSDITSTVAAPLHKEDSTNSWASFSPLDGQAVSSSAIELKDGMFSLYTEKSSMVHLPTTKMTLLETDQINLSKSEKDSVLKFYRKLQEGSILLISHHIKVYKEASKVITFARQKVEDEMHEEEIQEARRELKSLNVSEVLNLQTSSRDACINELLNSTEEVYLENFERKYQLSTKIMLAVENVGSAVNLLKHSLTTISALETVSVEGMSSYISSWYNLIFVCSKELQIGASIWAQSFNANLSDDLISSGESYFIALGEIYRIVEILRVTLKCFSALLLFLNQNKLKELDMCLDICTKAWSSGLDAALERISDDYSASALNAKALAESIKKMKEIDIQTDCFRREKDVCKLCLLPLALFPEMKSITWHGDRYILKLVNLWANKISPEPPKLPSIQM